MTHTGTNTYLIGQGRVAVIDPGPEHAGHLQAIMAATSGNVSHIFVTHAHLDHAPLARRLRAETGAPILAYGDARAGRATVMRGLDHLGGGEGVDVAFRPDITVEDGAEIAGDGWRLGAVWTPGHFGNHLCFAMDDVLFSGDLVMGWASTMISPPDGDVGQFMRSCGALRGQGWRVCHPGHGDPVDDPAGRIDWLLDNRRDRERQIRTILAAGARAAPAIAAAIYDDIPPALLPAATRNVLAHLIDMHDRSIVRFNGEIGPRTLARLV